MRIEDYDLKVIIGDKSIAELIEEATNTTWIPAQKGSEFKLIIFNNDDRRVLAVPLIDGLSVMNGKLGNVHSRGYILEPHKRSSILGWRIDNETVAAFKFDSAGKSMASFVKNDNRDIGIIQCAIYREKEYPKSRPKYVPPKPADTTAPTRSSDSHFATRAVGDFGGGFYRPVEPPSPQKNAPPSAAKLSLASQYRESQQEANETLAVGFGTAMAHHAKEGSFTSESGSPLCVLSIRYDSSINLAKRNQSVTSKAEYCEQWFHRGVQAMTANCVDEAIAAFTRVIKTSPDLAEAWEALMSVYESTDNFDLLADATRKLARLRYDNGDLWRKLGMLYIKRELWAQTIEPFDKYNALEPGEADSWNCLGMGLVKTGQLDEAWYCCDKALQLDPELSDAWDTLGLVHLQARRMDAATDAFSKAVDLDPQHVEALSNLWTTYRKLDRTKEASLVLTKLREVNPQMASKMRAPA